ncbi:MAG: hypothetical protein Q9173_004248 [Seirophora scorigena]
MAFGPHQASVPVGGKRCSYLPSRFCSYSESETSVIGRPLDGPSHSTEAPALPSVSRISCNCLSSTSSHFVVAPPDRSNDFRAPLQTVVCVGAQTCRVLHDSMAPWDRNMAPSAAAGMLVVVCSDPELRVSSLVAALRWGPDGGKLY